MEHSHCDPVLAEGVRECLVTRGFKYQRIGRSVDLNEMIPNAIGEIEMVLCLLCEFAEILIRVSIGGALITMKVLDSFEERMIQDHR